MRRRERVPLLYRTLFQITAMREDVGDLRGAIDDSEASRFFSRLDTLERKAVNLLEVLEGDRHASH